MTWLSNAGSGFASGSRSGFQSPVILKSGMVEEVERGRDRTRLTFVFLANSIDVQAGLELGGHLVDDRLTGVNRGRHGAWRERHAFGPNPRRAVLVGRGGGEPAEAMARALGSVVVCDGEVAGVVEGAALASSPARTVTVASGSVHRPGKLQL